MGTWLWAFPDDHSIWGPDSVEIKPDGTAQFARDKSATTWQREGKGRYSMKIGNSGANLIMVDRDHLDAVLLTGEVVKPRRAGTDAPPPAPAAQPAPVAAPQPAPEAPPPAAVVENASRLIKTSKRIYRSGEPVVVTYFNMPGGSTDWTSVAKASDATDDWGNWEYASGANGSRTLKNLKPGEYEARAYFNGTTNLEDKVAFTITP